MKSVAVLALAGAATAQVSLYTSIAGAINSQIGSLDSAIKAYTGGDGSAVIASASALLSAVEAGSAAAAKGSDITALGDALSLLPPYQGVVSSVKGVVGDLVSKKALASSNSLGGVAYSLLEQESSAANALAAVITGKLTGEAEGGKAIASGSIIVPLTSALNSGLAAFSPLSGQTTGGASKTTSGSSESSTTKSTTSTGSSTTSTGSTTSTTEVASTSSAPPQFTGNSANGLKVGSGLAAVAGALAYIL